MRQGEEGYGAARGKHTRATRSGLRKAWLKVHLYLALTVGVLVVVVGVTGSCNVFYRELDELLI